MAGKKVSFTTSAGEKISFTAKPKKAGPVPPQLKKYLFKKAGK